VLKKPQGSYTYHSPGCPDLSFPCRLCSRTLVFTFILVAPNIAIIRLHLWRVSDNRWDLSARLGPTFVSRLVALASGVDARTTVVAVSAADTVGGNAVPRNALLERFPTISAALRRAAFAIPICYEAG